MIIHNVKVFPSKIHLPKKKQLAWKIAEISNDNARLNKDAIEMAINRIIDNAVNKIFRFWLHTTCKRNYINHWCSSNDFCFNFK